MTIENDPPITGNQNSDRDQAPQEDDFDDVVFDDTSAAPAPMTRKTSPIVKYGLAAVLLMLAAGGAFYFMGEDDTQPAQRPAMVQSDADPLPPAMGEDDMMMGDGYEAPAESAMPAPEDMADMGGMSDLPPPTLEEDMADDENAAATEIGIADPEEVESVEEIDLESLGVHTVPGTSPDETLDVTAGDESDAAPGIAPVDPEDAAESLPELTAEDAIVTEPPAPEGLEQMPASTAQSQQDIDDALQEELIRSLMAPDPVIETETALPTEQVLINNTSRFEGQSMGGATAPPPSLAGGLRDIETQAMIRPDPQNFYIVRRESAPAARASTLMAAKRALRSGNNARALSLFDDAYEDSPNDPAAQMGRAMALQRLDRPNEALVAYERVLRDNPENLEALTNMLGILSAQNPVYAVEKLARLQHRYPNHTGLTVQLALAKADTDAVEEAIDLLQRAYNRDQGNATIAYNLGVMYDRMRDHVNAAVYYRQALARERLKTGAPSIPVAAIQQRLSMFR